MPGFEVADIVRELVADRHMRLPTDIRWMSILDADFPLFARNGARRVLAPLASLFGRSTPASVDIGSRIDRVFQDIAHTRIGCIAPGYFVWRRSLQRPDRQGKIGLAQIAHCCLCASQAHEAVEHKSDALLNLGVGIEHDPSGGRVDQPCRKRDTQFAARRLLPFPRVQAHADLMQLSLAHDPRETQQKPIMVKSRIIYSFAVGDENAEHRAELKQLMPVTVVACEARRVVAQNETGVTQANFSD